MSDNEALGRGLPVSYGLVLVAGLGFLAGGLLGGDDRMAACGGFLAVVGLVCEVVVLGVMRS